MVRQALISHRRYWNPLKRKASLRSIWERKPRKLRTTTENRIETSTASWKRTPIGHMRTLRLMDYRVLHFQPGCAMISACGITARLSLPWMCIPKIRDGSTTSTKNSARRGSWTIQRQRGRLYHNLSTVLMPEMRRSRRSFWCMPQNIMHLFKARRVCLTSSYTLGHQRAIDLSPLVENLTNLHRYVGG